MAKKKDAREELLIKLLTIKKEYEKLDIRLSTLEDKWDIVVDDIRTANDNDTIS